MKGIRKIRVSKTKAKSPALKNTPKTKSQFCEYRVRYILDKTHRKKSLVHEMCYEKLKTTKLFSRSKIRL